MRTDFGCVGRGDDIVYDFTIVIPAFNEEHRLPATLDRLLADLPAGPGDSWQVVVVDDGSTDATADVVRRAAADPRVRLVPSPTNRGKGAALRAGAMEAAAPVVVFLDADLPVSVDTVRLLGSATRTADLVLGSRRLAGSVMDPRPSVTRRVGAAGFRAALTAMGYSVASDPQCGVKAFRLGPLSPVLDQLTCDRFAFDVELIARSRSAGLRIHELPVRWRHVEGSSLRPVRDALVTLRDLRRLRGELRASPATGAP